ncbi:MAG: hypothetical protein ABIS86_21765 [Streptosporangiaceae bacterium]
MPPHRPHLPRRHPQPATHLGATDHRPPERHRPHLALAPHTRDLTRRSSHPPEHRPDRPVTPISPPAPAADTEAAAHPTRPRPRRAEPCRRGPHPGGVPGGVRLHTQLRRSQLAAALWNQRDTVPALSAGTDPAPRVHPRTVSTAHRHGLPLHAGHTAHVQDVLRTDDLIAAVCDTAYEELGIHAVLRWSVPDPVRADTDAAFEKAFWEPSSRIERLAPALTPAPGVPGPTPVGTKT